MTQKSAQRTPPPSPVPDRSVGDPEVNPGYDPLPDDPDGENEPLGPESVPVRDAPPPLPLDR